MRKKIEIYSYSIDIALLKNRAGEITSSTYLTSIDYIEGNLSNLNNVALLVINGYGLGVIWERNCFFLFDSHSKNSNGNICQNGTSVLLKFEMLNKLHEWVKDMCYIRLKHQTLYFRIHFINPLYSRAAIFVALERCLSF